ncbi:hypothetical protein L218DRAFT_1055679 [Marasmius fiardii PR-910]|nr:hypothetical protein L218DRAFT_1055679 [Marasmius fiardii PR-910]
MFSFKSLVVLLSFLVAVSAEATATTSATVVTAATAVASPEAAANSFASSITFTNVNPVGQVVAVQGLDNRPGFIVYQEASSGNLLAVGVSNSFSVGHRSTGYVVIVPSTEILWGSPLAIVNYEQGLNNVGEIEVFYLSPDNVISETMRGSNGQWLRGRACPSCIDSQVNYRAVWGSKVFFAMATANAQRNAGIRLVFQSVDYPADVIAEAARYGPWGLYPLRD